MVTSLTFGLIFLLTAIAYMTGRKRAIGKARAANAALHSRPQYYGAYVALWCAIPSLVFVLLWLAFDETIVQLIVLASLPADQVALLNPGQMSLLAGEIISIYHGQIFGEPEPYLREAAAFYGTLQALSSWAAIVVGLAAASFGLLFAQRQIAPSMRARNRVERTITTLLLIAALAAILTTIGIVTALVFESSRFFARVPPLEFLFGLNWEPQIPIRDDQVAGLGAFGALPVFWGTIFISIIAMTVAIPIGILSGVYMAEFASRSIRSILKPALEILAGVPTIVYGFFAVLVIAPALRRYGTILGLDVASNSALAAGGVMGFMLIPFISSFVDDALNAVPRSLREGSLAMGATNTETITRVLLPAALPGIVGGVLLAVSRAIGETMIVVMAAGLTARFTLNPLEGVTTVTVQIVTLLIGDTAFDNPKTLSAFGLGLVLFLSTLSLNIVALRTVKKYREQYD
ncbi:phosphate ABC transporter permease subunit PstC [Fodinicurvata sp. EGI_FJ10296]|uniref:phosphate ABC transporter permease subunit PstC n=1 Tax=Fodinicurvata sp. EGI_FJ10296 TaxID=3231908 RepID=UPI0034515F21